MYKIMIVDDELFVRMGLKVALDWEEHGFVLAGEASNGAHALSLMDQLMPDIVITDIKMPELDGIGLIKELSGKYPATKCLVLSNYDEFELVKEAMKMGAVDYLIKVTIEADSLLEALKQVCNKLDDQVRQAVNPHTSSTPEREQALHENKRWNQKKLITDVMAYGDHPEIVANSLKGLGIGTNASKGIIMLLTIADYENLLKQRFDGEAEQLHAVAAELADGLIDHRMKGRTLHWSDGCFMLLISSSWEIEDSMVYHLAEKIQASFEDYLNIEASFIYGISYSGYEQLSDSLCRLNDTRLIAFYEKPGSILQASNVQFTTEGMDQAFHTLKNQLSISLYRHRREGLDAAWREFMEYARSKQLNPALIKKYFVSVAGWIQETLLQISDKAMMIWQFDLTELDEIMTAEEFEQLCTELNDECERTIKLLGNDRQREEILKIIEFIRLNLQAKITLEDMARYVSMNKNYLSRLFKKETGKVFQEYLIDVRMKKAGEYLLATDLKISDIADRVGYADIFYFNRVFKSYYNMSPSEYKKSVEDSVQR